MTRSTSALAADALEVRDVDRGAAGASVGASSSRHACVDVADQLDAVLGVAGELARHELRDRAGADDQDALGRGPRVERERARRCAPRAWTASAPGTKSSSARGSISMPGRAARGGSPRPSRAMTEWAIRGSSSSVDLWMTFASRSYRPSSLLSSTQSGSAPSRYRREPQRHWRRAEEQHHAVGEQDGHHVAPGQHPASEGVALRGGHGPARHHGLERLRRVDGQLQLRYPLPRKSPVENRLFHLSHVAPSAVIPARSDASQHRRRFPCR